MNFQGRVFALMAGIAGTIAILLFTVFMVSSLLLGKLDRAYVDGKDFAGLVDDARGAQISLQRQVVEWKNILLRGTDPSVKKVHITTFKQYERQTQSRLKDLRVRLSGLGMQDELSQIDALIKSHDALGVRYLKTLETYPYLSYVGQQTIDRSVQDADIPVVTGMDKLVVGIIRKTSERFDAQSLAAHKDVTHRNLIFSVLALLLSGVLIYFVFHMVRQLVDVLGDTPERVVGSTRRIAKGDLTEKLDARKPSSLLGTLEMMQLRLRNIMLAVDSATQDFRANVKLIDKAYQRKALEDSLEQLDAAMSRIKVHRDT